MLQHFVEKWQNGFDKNSEKLHIERVRQSSKGISANYVTAVLIQTEERISL